jgi:hypothetical protein
MNRLGAMVGAAALALLCWRGPAMATSMLFQDVATLTQSSDAVVHGKVLKTASRWTSDGKKIVTDITVQVSDVLKGSAGKTVVVMQPGGEVGNIGQKVSGLASFSEGEEVVLFLEHQGAERYRLSGMAQGKFRVERSSDKTTAFAVPESVGDSAVIDPVTGGPTQEQNRPMELAALKAKIRAAAKASPNASPRGKAP